MTEHELFSALHHTHCSACQREEPRNELPGWPNNGKFIVLRRVKLCLGCAKELINLNPFLNPIENKGILPSDAEARSD